MVVLPSLTTTDRAACDRFLEAMGPAGISRIAFFATAVPAADRKAIYSQLEAVPGLQIPHVHVRTDFDQGELEYCRDRFATVRFNVHPAASTHPYPALASMPAQLRSLFYLENVEVCPEEEELDACGGFCADYAHAESARHRGDDAYYRRFLKLLDYSPPGCCHVSAVRVGSHNRYNGGPDQHRLSALSDLDYLERYKGRLPRQWVSLELENDLDEQLACREYLYGILGPVPTAAGSGGVAG